MTHRMCLILLLILLASCASEPPANPLADIEELNSMRILDAPSPVPGNFAPENRYMVERGEYLVELLGCGGCHTDGALEGAPSMDKALAGSGIGIAYMNPFGNDRPGVVGQHAKRRRQPPPPRRPPGRTSPEPGATTARPAAR